MNYTDINKVMFNQISLNRKGITETILLELIVSNEIKGKCILSIINKEEAEISNMKMNEENNMLYRFLFKEIEKILKEKQLSIIYMTVFQNVLENMGIISALEKHLINSKWNLHTNQNIFIFDGGKMNKDNWLKEDHLSKDFRIDSIHTVTKQEKEEIEKGKNIWYPNRFYPFQYNNIGKNSLVMRFKGSLIGWCITDLASENMLLYDNLFVKKEYWNLGRSISLFGMSLKIQCEESDIRYITFTVHGDNNALLKILRKKSVDYIVDFKELKLYKLIL